MTAQPSDDDVLAWLSVLSADAVRVHALESGGAIVNQAIARYGQEQLSPFARSIMHLQEEGFVAFEDPAATIDQASIVDRLRMAVDLRLTARGRDRVRQSTEGFGRSPVQIVVAEQAQIAARDINNQFNTYDELLARIAAGIEAIDGISDETRDEARGFLQKLRAKSDSVATGTATAAGGAVVGALLRQLLGLP